MMFSLINEPKKQQPETINKIPSTTHKNNTGTTNMANLNAHSPIKYVINLFPNVCSQAQELAIDAMQSGL